MATYPRQPVHCKLKFLSELGEIFNSGAYSDLTVKAGPATFKVHKAMLGVRTKFFEMATREDGFLESKDNIVTIKEHSAHSVWRFLTYCYVGDYLNAENEEIDEDDDGTYLKHIRVHALADMLDVPNLKIIAAEKLKMAFQSWDTGPFIQCVKEIYATTNTGDIEIRNVLLCAAAKNIHSLLGMQTFQNEFEGYGEFLAALLMKIKPQINSDTVTPRKRGRHEGFFANACQAP